MEAWRTISRSLIGRPRRYLPGTMGPEMIARMAPRSGRPARTWSIVTCSQSWPASRIAPTRYRGYGEMYGGTPKFDGSSTYPSRTTTFMGPKRCRAGDKRASPDHDRLRGPLGFLGYEATHEDDEDDHNAGPDDGRYDQDRPFHRTRGGGRPDPRE